MALVVTDDDARNGLLSVGKARVAGVDRDWTKTRQDRRVVLCFVRERALCSSDSSDCASDWHGNVVSIMNVSK